MEDYSLMEGAPPMKNATEVHFDKKARLSICYMMVQLRIRCDGN